MFSIDQNSHSLWDSLPKVQALASRARRPLSDLFLKRAALKGPKKLRWTGVIVGAVGVIGLGTGALFSVRAVSAAHDFDAVMQHIFPTRLKPWMP